MPAAPRAATRGAPIAPGGAPGATGATATLCPACPDAPPTSPPSSQQSPAALLLILRRAAIRYLHVVAGCAVPTAEAAVGETMAGITRHAAETGQVPARKLAATAAILRQILAPIEADLAGLPDRRQTRRSRRSRSPTIGESSSCRVPWLPFSASA
jgi:hypothetical protein